jgi:hypothetical protein
VTARESLLWSAASRRKFTIFSVSWADVWPVTII